MTAPQQEDGKAPAKPKLQLRNVGELVGFTFNDPITGARISGAAVVLAPGSENEAAQIAPLSREVLHVHPADLVGLAADDVTSQ